MKITATAPGKLLLLGEYAVLDGAPALVMAVDRRARVSLETAADFSVDAPHMNREPTAFQLDSQGRPRWQSPESAERFRLLDHVLRQRTGKDRPAPFRAVLDTSEFFHEENKLGLGSSAALTVALDGALAAWTNQARDASRDAAFNRLLPIHRGLQDGHGSGFDVAAALCGATLGFRLQSEGAEIHPARLPDALHVLCVWSGKSAATGDLVGQVKRWQAGQPEAAHLLFEDMNETARAGVEAVHNQRTDTLLQAADDYCGLLERLGRNSGADIVSAEHRRIRRLAEERGGVYKPCGAGGGDVGVIMTDDAESIPKLRSTLQYKGFPVIPLHEDPSGLRVDTRRQHGTITHT